MKKLRKIMAYRCENCPICSYARSNPEKLIGKVMTLHGKFCPFWKAWQAEYGAALDKTSTEV